MELILRAHRFERSHCLFVCRTPRSRNISNDVRRRRATHLVDIHFQVIRLRTLLKEATAQIMKRSYQIDTFKQADLFAIESLETNEQCLSMFRRSTVCSLNVRTDRFCRHHRKANDISTAEENSPATVDSRCHLK
jgi:hypothetical protein